MISDILSHLFTAIRNGHRNKKSQVTLKTHSKTAFRMLIFLKKEGFIRGFCFQKHKNKLMLHVFLKYTMSNRPVFGSIQKISKPGRRVSINLKTLIHLHSGYETFILSTPRGFLTDYDAILLKHGGEVVCKIK